MDNVIKITGFKRTTGIYNGKEFDNVRIQCIHRVTPLNPNATDYVDKVSKKVVGSGVTTGSWLDVQESKLRTGDALVIFGCKSFDALVQLCGKRFSVFYNRYGSIECVEEVKE